MKGTTAVRLVNEKGWAALGAFVSPNGKLSSTDGCIARMAVVSDGKGAAEVVVLAPPSELLESCLADYDWLSRWNRLRVYHPPGESKQQAKASARIERLLARAMKNHLHDEDPSAASAALKKAFGRKLMEWLETENAGDTEVDGSGRLEITDVRPLDADEQEQVRDQVPAKWLPKIEDSMSFVNCIEIEGQAVRERSEGFWRRPGLFKRLGIVGIATASGLVITGFLLYRFGPRYGGRSSDTTAYNSSSSDTTASSSTVGAYELAPTASGTAIPGITTSSSTLSTTRFPSTAGRNMCEGTTFGLTEPEKYQRALACDCLAVSESSLFTNCHPNPEKRPEPSVDVIASLLSGYELATLRVPSGTCKETLHRSKTQTVVRAEVGGWRMLDWSELSEGGQIVCTDENGLNLNCHYFGAPSKFDFPTVWDAINLYVKPYQCLAASNPKSQKHEVEYYGGRARGVARYVGGDLYGLSDDHLEQLGLKVVQLNPLSSVQWEGTEVYPKSDCNTDGPTCRTNISEHCQCEMIEMYAHAITPSGKTIHWGSTKDYFTNQTDLAKYYTLFQRKGYKPVYCHVKCWRDPQPALHREHSKNFFRNDLGQQIL
ncbi:putative transmembrane protein [Gregarina niphandrodes]|uniref:Transmembrane protein n=1 Tax=Gregarina niphandrodes TaxID=110365 RepID=A0A023B095_GRENI|nr:putative transmembrane protein [Gregarina niphandrodes]EZG44014.1 putative transmembrane protein [Gregarina niphandrodes]|eukprot:XP_011132847.1 putative transmembrane protein [Gregarina niphandrodes]